MIQWNPGDELTIDQLNELADLAYRAGNLRVDPASGLRMVDLPDGKSLGYDGPLEIWVKITSGGTGGIYGGTQQLPVAGGTWVNGSRTFTVGTPTLYEANLNAAVPAGGTVIVRAFRDRQLWRFAYGAC